MSKIWTIIKKELKRFFSDKRMLANLILPGVMIFIVYSLMGTFMKDAFSPDKEYSYRVVVNNMVEEYSPIFNSTEDFEIEIIKDKDVNTVKEDLKNNDIDLFVEFDKDFKSKLEAGQKPTLDIFFNSSSNESSNIYTYMLTLFQSQGTEVNYKFLVNMNPDLNYNLATKEDMSAKMIQMMLPYLLVIFLFSGCLAITSESIAGEKERGTINTLLVTPTKRSHIAIGKIIALSITGLVSATSSFIGLLCSLPLLMQMEDGLTISMYGVGTYFGLYLIIVTTIILFTTLLSIVSTYAKNVKEANQLASVLMVLVMVLGITSLMGGGNIPTQPGLYLIPVYNSVQSMSFMFAMQFNPVNFVITIVSNIIYIGLGIYLLAKMFDSEKIMSIN